VSMRVSMILHAERLLLRRGVMATAPTGVWRGVGAVSRLTAPLCHGMSSLLPSSHARTASTCVPTMLLLRDPLRAARPESGGLLQTSASSPLLPCASSPLLHLSGARRYNKSIGRQASGHRRGGARAQPERKAPKHRRNPGDRKLKSHKGALKRFYQLADGTFMHKAAGKKHLMAGTSRSRQSSRLMAHRPVRAKGIIRKLKRLLPYGTTLQPPRRHKHGLLWERPPDWRERVEAEVQKVREAAEKKVPVRRRA